MSSISEFTGCLFARASKFSSRPWVAYVLLGAIGFLVHVPALSGTLIWDDGYLARDNPFIKSPLLALEAFRHYLFLDSFSGHYRPVQNLSFMLDYYFWNSETSGYHLTNVLLHLASGLLLFVLLQKLFTYSQPRLATSASDTDALQGENQLGRTSAFFVAAIWIVHPVHSAAVDYISGRADSLAFLFCCAAWLLVFQGRKTVARWLQASCYLAAGVCALLGMCAREIGCVWVLIFLVYTFVFERNKATKTRIFSAIGCAAVLAGYVALHSLPAARPVQPGPHDWDLVLRITLLLRALGDYTRLLIWPANLHMERTVFDPAYYHNLAGWRENIALEYLSILGTLALICCGYGCCRRGIGRPLRVFGTIWFFVAFLPVSNLFPLNATCAEHWLYLPSVGFLLFLLGWLIELPLQLRRISVGVATVAIVALGIRGAIRSSDWTDELTFYNRTFAAGGGSGRVAINVGLNCVRQKDYPKAERIFRRVLELMPDYITAENDLADVLVREGKIDEAEKLFADLAKRAPEAAKQYPRSWVGILNLAHLRHRAKDDGGAIALLERARADYPDIWELVSLESELTRQTQGPVAALALVERFSRANWWHHGAALALGRLHAQNNEVARATEALERAAQLDVHDVEALNLLAQIYLRQNQLEHACTIQRRAVARQPYQPGQYLILAEILDEMGRVAEAKRARDQVTHLEQIASSQRVAAN